MKSSENNNIKHAHIDIHNIQYSPTQNLQSPKFESRLPNPNTPRNSQNRSYKTPQKKSSIRWIISLAGFITPNTLLLNGLFLTSSWFGDYDSVDYINHKHGKSLEYNVVKTTFLTVLFSTICGLGSIMLAILIPNVGKYKHVKATLNYDYYGSFFASSLSLLVAGLLIYDYIVTENFSKKGSGMTTSQRKLHFSVFAVYIWTAIGAGVFMLVEEFDFNFSVYFCFVTAATIGFGDVVPQRASSKTLTLVWLFIGIIIFGIYLVNARDVVAQTLSKRYRKRLRRKILVYYRYNDNHSVKLSRNSSYKTYPKRNRDSQPRISNTKKKFLDLFALICLPFQFLRSLARNIKVPKKHPIKKWTYPQALYFCFVSFATVGYGDVTPNSRLSIIFFNFIIVIAVSNFAGYVASVVELFQYLMLLLLEHNIVLHIQPEYYSMRRKNRFRKINPIHSQNELGGDNFSTIFHPRPIIEQTLESENEYFGDTNTDDYYNEKYIMETASLPDIWPRKDL
ncbi:hypothetical protein BB558_006150 [Smittium angustum]|uniref:Potassium channel domain-containing protein n=1 Tax=Smittium angustum TaxID=133377 RepID=A0A2U1IYI2_SMIAN|nr:hypothetical protein BB558_006150 [Smittium angustum]